MDPFLNLPRVGGVPQGLMTQISGQLPTRVGLFAVTRPEISPTLYGMVIWLRTVIAVYGGYADHDLHFTCLPLLANFSLHKPITLRILRYPEKPL